MAKAESEPGEKSPEEEKPETRKVGFLLSPETDFKLTVLARKLHVSRSQLVEECLVERLRGIVISFRNNASKAG